MQPYHGPIEKEVVRLYTFKLSNGSKLTVTATNVVDAAWFASDLSVESVDVDQLVTRKPVAKLGE